MREGPQVFDLRRGEKFLPHLHVFGPRPSPQNRPWVKFLRYSHSNLTEHTQAAAIQMLTKSLPLIVLTILRCTLTLSGVAQCLRLPQLQLHPRRQECAKVKPHRSSHSHTWDQQQHPILLLVIRHASGTSCTVGCGRRHRRVQLSRTTMKIFSRIEARDTATSFQQRARLLQLPPHLLR